MSLLYKRAVANYFKYRSRFCPCQNFTTRINACSSRTSETRVSTQPFPSHYSVSTPIFYVNAVPHIGHLYTVVLADALARWHKILGSQVLLSTGTDEHGLKIQQAAASMKKDPQSWCDQVSAEFRALFDKSNIEYTHFIRTTDPKHKEAVSSIWNRLISRGYIYKGSYEGWYSTQDEAFLSEDQITDSVDKHGKDVKVSIESGHPVEWTKEENYMFTLSRFKSDLLKWLDGGVIKPVKFEAIVRMWIQDGLPDISVSRQRDRLHWGIPVPKDPSQTIYVWLDALINYLTVTGYPNSSPYWPTHCNIVGKDILRFHAIYWPAFLLGAGMSPPRSILCHSHWTVDNRKMSKSVGNVVDPVDRLSKYGTDGLRYFLLTQGVPHSDGNYSDNRVKECINSELVNTFGNLLSRITAPSINIQQTFPPYDVNVFRDWASAQDIEMWAKLSELPYIVDGHFRSYEFYKGIDAIMSQLRLTNTFVQTHKPWTLTNDDQFWLDNIICVTMETLRVAAILLQPVTPELAGRVLDRLGVKPVHRDFQSVIYKDHLTKASSLGEPCGVLVPRIK